MPANMSPRHRPHGIISLLALLIMAAVTATSIAAAAIIINELQQTESLSQAVSATYASEAGLENGLYIIKVNRATSTLSATECILGDPSNPSCSVTGTMSNTATWSRTSQQENQFLISRLSADQTASLDFYNPDDPKGGSGIQSIEATWSVNCNQTVQLEVTMLTWDMSKTNPFDPSNQVIYKQTFACNQPNQSGGGACTTPVATDNISGHIIVADQPYRFTFRVLVPVNSSCEARGIDVTGYSEASPGDPHYLVNVPARIDVESVGTFGGSNQALTASVPWRAPISGLLGFVVFSEQTITK